jgi:7-carboxy-7-deazaguanine synthase
MSQLDTVKTKEELKLRISEIFYSIQGETKSSGYPTVFIRLTGCPLRCLYCDTSYAFTGGKMETIESILKQVKKYNAHHITVTGGEPLAQRNCLALLELLCDNYKDVSLETSGALDISEVDMRVRCVLDIKTPDSGEESKNYLANLDKIKTSDEIKFVICSKNDYNWAVSFVEKYELLTKAPVIFSPSHNTLDIRDLAEWIIETNINVRLQTQLHKIIWGDMPGK